MNRRSRLKICRVGLSLRNPAGIELLITLLIFVAVPKLWALDWIYLTPNPAYSRDLAMGVSTLALAYPPHSQSINPAGFTAFSIRSRRVATVFFNPGGLWQLRNYLDAESHGRSDLDHITEPARLLVNSVAVRWKIATLAGLFAQPVMLAGDSLRYRNYESSSGLSAHQNSVLFALDLHPRISVAGRIDRYYRYSDPQGEGYSYGVILRPRRFDIAVQYQRFPASGARLWHPLDRRLDQSVSAGIAFGGQDWKVTSQVMNLTSTSDTLSLEPHVGAEWRPLQHFGLRAGILSYSDNDHWAWTSGICLFDANVLRDRRTQLPVPDDILQISAAVLYHHRQPELGICSLTLSWRL